MAIDEVTRVILGARASQVDRIKKSISNADSVLDSDEEELRKGEDPDEDGEETEKSDIANALSGYDSNIKITKTGKEIKTQVSDVIVPELTAVLAQKESEAGNLLEKCGNAPTRDPECWWTDGIKMDCGYKIYDWIETELRPKDGRLMEATLSAQDAAEKRGNVPEDAEQAKARQEYNRAVQAICNIKVDLKTCDIIAKNLKDGDKFQLNPRQVIALKF